MSFTAYDKAGKKIATFKSLANAMQSKPYVVKDKEGLQYFTDGTGSGFSSIKESNAGMQFEHHKGIYNQRRKSIESVKAVSWHIFWETKSRAQVRNYHQRIRQLVKSGELKILEVKNAG